VTVEVFLRTMLSLLSSILIAQASPSPKPEAPKPEAPKPETISLPQEIRLLPGQLDSVLVFNSNSPEVVQTEGILLSTFPKSDTTHPEAHLNQAFQGRFDIFTHHISNKVKTPEDLKTLYMGIVVFNPGSQPVTIDVLQAASYLSQPDAPFITLPPMVDNPAGNVFAGPGDRATNDILRGLRQRNWPAKVTIPPRSSQLLFDAPIPVKDLAPPPINGRSTLAHLRSTGPVHIASLALFAKTDASGQERAPTFAEWENLLKTGNLAGPRDKVPTPPDAPGKIVYGRVAGVARGSQWKAQLTDPGSTAPRLTIPKVGEAFSYVLSTVARGTFGTGQVQSAPMVARYPDTAYAAHGNYGIEYSLTLPLHNPSEECKTVMVLLQTPIKTDEKSTALKFFNPAAKSMFFRGTVRVRYQDDNGAPQNRYVHLAQFRGQQGDPLVQLALKPKTSRLVKVDFLYPPDATPPQVLTVKTEKWAFDPKSIKTPGSLPSEVKP
jgi:Protein of unknown function (DUF3370)